MLIEAGKGRYGVVFAVRVQVWWPIRVSRYKVDQERVTSHCTLSFIVSTGAPALTERSERQGSRYKQLQICHGCRSKSKNRDKQLTHIVRVSISGQFYNCHWVLNLSVLSERMIKSHGTVLVVRENCRDSEVQTDMFSILKCLIDVLKLIC